MIQASIRNLAETKLMGQQVTLTMKSLAPKNRALWQSFMARQAEIEQRLGTAFYALEMYPDPGFFSNFNPDQEFQKWAAVSVSDFDTVPNGLETLIIPAGLYAVFPYKGRGSEAGSLFQYIFGTWLPQSEYNLDHRPHFALMGEKYKNEDPNSEEDFWVPIR